MTDCLRLSMWSGPRNISTALMYAFRQRPDTAVVDEPLYAHYLEVTGLEHPGFEDVLAAQETLGSRVVADILLADCAKPIRFFKNMAHHLAGFDINLVDSLSNVLLTRNPREMLVSLTKGLPNADVDATGLPDQVRLLDHLIATRTDPIVLDSSEILKDPRSVLSELCERLAIPFYDEMLSWPAGPKPEDGVWARHWYTNVHRSTGFAPYRAPTQPIPRHLASLLEQCEPAYERLIEYAIRAPE